MRITDLCESQPRSYLDIGHDGGLAEVWWLDHEQKMHVGDADDGHPEEAKLVSILAAGRIDHIKKMVSITPGFDENYQERTLTRTQIRKITRAIDRANPGYMFYMCAGYRREPVMLAEAPIADFQYIDKSEEMVRVPNGGIYPRDHSFDANDRKALQNPKWKAKVVHAFRKTTMPINVYAINVKWLTINTKISTQVALTTDVSNLESFAGSYDKDNFKETFGFLPPEWENSISFAIMQNEGDQKHPLTPWMLGHRMIHAFLNEQTRGFNHNDFRREFDKAWRRIQETFEYFEEKALRISKSPYGFGDPKRRDELYAKIASFGSARNKKIPHNRQGEFYVECMTNYLLNGNFGLNFEGIPHVDEYHIFRLTGLLDEAKQAMDEGLELAKGHLIVF